MSNMTYLEGACAQDLPHWIDAHIRAFEYFAGAAAITVPDNTKTAVIRACRYEPELNRTYAEMAAHYGTVIIPARPRKPRDRAKGENAVQVVERVVLAPLRGRTFLSLAEVNQALAEGRERLNDLPFQKLPGSRRTLFETLDRPALQPLPAERYELAQWRTVRVNIDYHCELLRNYYSVPYQLVHEVVEARLTTSTVEFFYKGRRIASHVRLWGMGQYSTDPQHRPVAHQKHLEWTPSRLIGWAETNGPHTAALVSALLASKPHPEQGYRACLGVMRLGKRYAAVRLEAACARALAVGAVSYRSVKSILETGLDRQPLAVQGAVLALDVHANVRGAAYYAAGVIGADRRVAGLSEANRPDGTPDQAHQMPQDRFVRGGEASGYPPVQASLPGNASTEHGAAHTALIPEEVTHADPTHA
jgi:transposase